jgi:hypothetical protein
MSVCHAKMAVAAELLVTVVCTFPVPLLFGLHTSTILEPPLDIHICSTKDSLKKRYTLSLTTRSCSSSFSASVSF